MAKKPSRPYRMAPLQRITGEEITDPAEQAAIDRMRKRLKRQAAVQNGKTGRSGRGAGRGS